MLLLYIKVRSDYYPFKYKQTNFKNYQLFSRFFLIYQKNQAF